MNAGLRMEGASSPSPRLRGEPQAGRGEGRICPLDYFYDPAVFTKRADFAADILYVAGGLYGNLATARCAATSKPRSPAPWISAPDAAAPI